MRKKTTEMVTAKALWFTTAGHARVSEEHLLDNEGKLLIKSLASCVSIGTERKVLFGEVPVEIQDQMKLKYQSGTFQFPIKYGYSLVGRIIQSPVDDLLGRLVHVLHPHQDYVYVDPDDVFVLPEDIDPKLASLLSNLETAVTAIWDAKPLLGEKILIVGFGLLGSLIARILTDKMGFQVSIHDISNHKISLAKKLGFSCTTPSQLEEKSFHLSFNCSGSYDGLQIAIDATTYEGRTVDLGWYGETKGILSLGGTFHSGRKTLISSQVSHIPNPKQWDFKSRKKICLELVEELNFSDHITRIVNFDSLPEFYKSIDKASLVDLGVIVDYS